MKVLLIDDNLSDNRISQIAFENIGYYTLFAINGKDAIIKLTQNDELPDLIFLDLNMPIMNGMEFIKEIKTNEKYSQYANIPIVIFTGLNIELEENIKKHIDGKIIKPVKSSELKIEIAKILNKNDNKI